MSIKSIKTGYTGISALAGNLPYGDFESIASYTVTSGGTSNITFSSVPNTFQHLQIRMMFFNATGGANVRIRFNSDTSSNYTFHQVYGDGGSAAASGDPNTTGITGPLGGNTIPASAVIDILDYNSVNKFKTVRSLGGYDANGSGYVMLRSGAWRKSPIEAITSIELTLTSGNYSEYTHAALYGIR